MIFSISSLNAGQRHAIRSVTTMRPVPQLPVWENMARRMAQNGFYPEACFMLDMIAVHYGKASGRACAERIFDIQMHHRGRGICSDCAMDAHPSVFFLRDETAPIALGNQVILQSGENILIASPESSRFRFLHAIAQSPSAIPVFASQNKSIHWIAFDHFLIYADGTQHVYFLDLSSIPAPNDESPMPLAVLTFDSAVRNISGPLDDGTFFVTLAPPLPVFSDVCKLCSVDTSKIRTQFEVTKKSTLNIRDIGALGKEILLSNIEQTLRGDCVPAGTHFVTCGGGMQNREVRFIDSDGSWTTRFVHESPVIRILASERGPVSLDESGQAFLWNDRSPVDDTRFAINLLPDIFRANLHDVLFSIDWTHKRLYLTVTRPPQSMLKAALAASHSCCITADSADNDAFIKHVFHLKSAEIAMCADGSLHFWDIANDCVDARWQLSKACAETSDWHAVLDARSPEIERDPRIRMIDMS